MACPEHVSHLGCLKIVPDSCTACTRQTWSPESCAADVEVAPLCIELGKMFSQNKCQQHAVAPQLTNHCCFQKFTPSSLLLIIQLGDLWRKILDQPCGIQYMLGLTSPLLPHGRIHTTLLLPFFLIHVYSHYVTPPSLSFLSAGIRDVCPTITWLHSSHQKKKGSS